MHLEGSYTFAATREQLWRMLHDPNILAKIIPGCEQISQISADTFQLTLQMKAGPVAGPMQAEIQLSNIQSPESYSLQFSAKGDPGFLNGRGTIRLESDAYMTQIHYAGDAQAGGSLAGLGPRLLDTTAKAYIRLSLEGLGQELQQRQMVDIAPAAGLDQEDPEPSTFSPMATQTSAGTPAAIWGSVGFAAAVALLLILLGRRRTKS